MKLGEWLKANKKTQAWLAKQMKSDQSHVSEWVTGKVTPTVKTIVKILKVTNGGVTYMDWVSPQFRGGPK